jgi:serine protease
MKDDERTRNHPPPHGDEQRRNVPRRVVVKFRDDINLPYRDDIGDHIDRLRPARWETLKQKFPGITLNRLFTSLDPAQIREMVERAAGTDPGYLPLNLLGYYAMDCPPGVDAETLAKTISSWPEVETAYVEGGQTPPPTVAPDDDPRSHDQGYLNSAPIGIDARYAWQFAGGDGEGIRFVDVEQGWTLDHQDLAGAGITLISGLSLAYFGHGTAVLGVVAAIDNSVGCVGITPRVKALVVSQHRTANNFNTAEAILSGVHALSFGDVLLLEAQTVAAGHSFLPVEVERAVFDTIRLATALGVVVVEAAGNGAEDLDAYTNSGGEHVLSRAGTEFQDSGAVMVGSARSVSRRRLADSNFGSRIDCYAWGQNINTTGDGNAGTSTTIYTAGFGGTSGASAIVAGAAIAAQGIRARLGQRFSPPQLRAVLSDPASGTPSATPPADRIGIMPNLKAIIDNVHPQ